MDYAGYYFRNEYKLGSNRVAIYNVEFHAERTTAVSGWPRMRTSGRVGIAYYDAKRSLQRTSKTFDVLTEEKNGEIVAVDIDVGW